MLPFAGFAPATSSASAVFGTSSSNKRLNWHNENNNDGDDAATRQRNTSEAGDFGFGTSTSSSSSSSGTLTSFGGRNSDASSTLLGGMTGGERMMPPPPLNPDRTAATMTRDVSSFGGILGGGTTPGGSAASTSSPALLPAPTIRSVALVATAPSSSSLLSSDKVLPSVENSCVSMDGRSFHSYLYDPSSSNGWRHAIVSDFAPFDNTSPNRGGGGGSGGGVTSSLTITTILPSAISDAINVDPVLGLICIDGSNDQELGVGSRRGRRGIGEGEVATSTSILLPWMCLYTRKSAFVLLMGYSSNDENKENYNDDGVTIQRRCLDGRILRVVEPFERQLMLMSPRGSTILRICPAPSASSSSPVFHRRGSMAMLIKEGGTDDNAIGSGYALVLYHGLPESAIGAGSRGVRGDFGGRSNPVGEGSVTTPLRFNNVDLVRGLKDTVDAENEAYNQRDRPPTMRLSSSSADKRVVDFCFTNPSLSATGNAGFSAMSIFVLCSDGSVYGASPIIFDGTVLPRSVVVTAITQLDDEIEASTLFLQHASSSSPAPTLDQECMEARTRQCRAARRYLLDVFGIPDLTLLGSDSSPANQGSYYVCASVVLSRSYTPRDNGGYSQALAWQPRLQGPLILQSDSSTLPPCVCIEPFGGAAGAGIIDGFVVARYASSTSQIHVEFGIVPGEGSVLLPRFVFESDSDCQLIDELVRGTGMYVERATIAQDKIGSDVSDKSGGTCFSSRALLDSRVFIGRECSIVHDPLDDAMIHVINRSQISTITTNAIAITSRIFASRVSELVVSTNKGENEEMSSIRTNAWSGLEVNSSGTALVGARVSGNVHLGHVLYVRLSDGSMEIVNVTAAHCLHRTSEQMMAKSVPSHASHDASQVDDKALEALKIVKPLHEILHPMVTKVCDGISKLGKIVGGATLPKDAGPENIAVFLDTQHSCEVNVLMPMEEMSKVLSARRELLKEMYDHQSVELVRLSELLTALKQKNESNHEHVLKLETNASILAKRSSAVLTATRDLRPQITDAEAEYFKELQRYETSCRKWEGTVDQIQKDASSSCDIMSAGAIENGDVLCLVDLPPAKIEYCQKLLRGEGKMLHQIEKDVKKSSEAVEQLSKIVSGFPADACLKLQ